MGVINETPVDRLAPVDPGHRIEAIDMVRGFALFGVLLVNMFNFGAYSITWNEAVDQFAFSIMRVFFETKSWRLFSFLFGLGFAIQLMRAQQRDSNITAFYLRRMAILFAIGAGHALIYRGDILMLYAELGVLLLFLRNVPPRRLLILSVCLLAIFPIGHAATTLIDPVQAVPADFATLFESDLAELEESRKTHIRAVGSITQVMAFNARLSNPFKDILGPESSIAVFAMFLLGLYAGRLGILSDISGHLTLIRKIFRWGFPIGLLSMAAERALNATTGYAVFRDQQASLLPQLLGDLIFTYGSTILALSYAAGIVLLAQHAIGKRLLAPFGAAGRIGLTIYLSGSLMFGTLFYGFAFGNIFRLGPAAVMGYAVLFFTLLMLFATWWTSRFRFGPAEWFWRALTYLKLPPMKL
jgi:uncharacterized protein